ncbi:MAG: hypothetical protein P8I91_03330 [Phycisphaerales bacterium]|nr:hypothetical protein [Phycisphaerales bacterium]
MSIAIASALFQGTAPTVQWGGANSGVNQTRIQLVTDAEMLKEVWQFTHGDSIAGLPQINFDRCRVVLACRGREMNVQRVTAMEIDQVQQETILTIDAEQSSRVDGNPPEETTAWGLFIIPMMPELVRVRVDVSQDRDGEPQWETIAILGHDANQRQRGGEQAGRQDSRFGEPGPRSSSHSEISQEFEDHLERMRRPFTKKLAQPPHYFISHGYDERWSRAIKLGIDVARDYLGNHGPVQVYIVGQEDDELSDPAHRDAIAETFCKVHNAGSDQPMEDCLSRDGQEMTQKAIDGETEAFMTMAMDADPPTAELVFINAHTMGGEEMMPTRSIHEYTHVYQKSFEFTPTWMMEGGAEFLACHLGEQHGWGDRDQTMEWYARQLDQVEDLEYTISDMEEIETAMPDVARWHRELAYDAGAWAVAFAISKSPSRSISQYYRSFYPMVDEMGWQAALCQYTRMDNIDSFYEGFESLSQQPLADRLAMLGTLKD